MKASEAGLLSFLQSSPQLVIPIYQRTYSWTERECRQLWNDILRVGQNENISAHFVGSIVYIQQGLYQVTGKSPLLVIDGQQRLTTISILLEALARFVGEDEPFDGFSAQKIREYYLINRLEKGDRYFKLLLTQTDKESLLALVQQKAVPADSSVRILESFGFFVKQIQGLGSDVAALCKGLAKLIIVDISLSRDQDNPQLIFESMNSTGRELSQADLIRNYVLMGLEPELQTELYEVHWRPMEIAFGQEAYGEKFDSFMRDYLTLKTGDIPNVRKVYEAFKIHATECQNSGQTVASLVADIQRFAGYYCAMALAGKEPEKNLSVAFQDLRELKIEVAYPLLLHLYHDYRNGDLVRDDFATAVRLVEAFVFRRAACGIPTNALNKIFATFSRGIRKETYLESIQARLLLLLSSSRFPDDEEFKRELKIRDLYMLPRRSYFLRRLENWGKKEYVEVNEYTIEHIMPQNEKLSARWKEDLGPEWERIHHTWLHTLGNLTLTGYNSEYSDRSFIEKRDMEGGFKQSPLKLNEGLGNLDSWNEVEIAKRAERLADRALKVWAAPTLPDQVLEAYRPKIEKTSSYGLGDHPQLDTHRLMRPVFDVFRKEVLALDPNVTEEFFKIYVAYKAETNFVDVAPQSKQLLLTLNMPFHEVHDPRGLCKDMTDVGKHGNGDVQIGLRSIDDVPYVLGLVRQSLERQMGGNGATD